MLVLLLLLWELASRAGLVNQIYVPPVSKIGAELWRLVAKGRSVLLTQISAHPRHP